MGARAQHYRAARPQVTVATSMRMMGHPAWRQSTVVETEQGKRSLKLSEAITLASIIGCSVEELIEGVQADGVDQ